MNGSPGATGPPSMITCSISMSGLSLGMIQNLPLRRAISAIEGRALEAGTTLSVEISVRATGRWRLVHPLLSSAVQRAATNALISAKANAEKLPRRDQAETTGPG